MKFTVKRFDKENSPQIFTQEYEIKEREDHNLLAALLRIKQKEDNSLCFRCGCKSGVCGSCAVRVNGVERLACKTKIQQGDRVEPLNNSKVLRDLMVDLSSQEEFIRKSEAHLHQHEVTQILQTDVEKIERQSNCILCQSCFSSCPVYEVNKSFLGPYALTRSLRYVDDKKEQDKQSILSAIQKDGVWDCTLCGNCTMVCPQFIDPKTDIMQLRMKSVQNGFEDPTLQNFANIGNEFDTGFDPSGGFNGGFNPNF